MLILLCSNEICGKCQKIIFSNILCFLVQNQNVFILFLIIMFHNLLKILFFCNLCGVYDSLCPLFFILNLATRAIPIILYTHFLNEPVLIILIK